MQEGEAIIFLKTEIKQSKTENQILEVSRSGALFKSGDAPDLDNNTKIPESVFTL